MAVLGKALFMSRNRMEATSPQHHASFTVLTIRWIELVPAHPGHPPKWFAGRMLHFSHMVIMSSVWQLFSRQE